MSGRMQKGQAVRNSFDTLVRNLTLSVPVELRVIRGDTLAETLQGHVVVANESLAEWSEAEREFVLAHELGHIVLNHWSQMGLMFQKWVPGTVIQQETDAVALLLGRDASGLAYRQEFEADAFAARMMATLSGERYDALAVFMRLGAYKDTATHPGTQRRLAALRAAAPAPAPAPAPKP
ncbi:MAG TPA: M48 family metalloprotease [Rhizobacter sp.]|nr:M48 family metalloprotease [Rhizobacter sp.]